MKYLLKFGKASFQIPCGSKIFAEVTSCTAFEIQDFVFCIFEKKCEKLQMAAIYGRTNFFFENWVSYSADLPLGQKFCPKSLYLAWFSRYKQFCVLQFLKKIRKFKMAAIFGK